MSSMKFLLILACLPAMHAVSPKAGFLTQMKVKNTDPKCRTGVLSVPLTADEEQVCCAGFCGECSNHDKCNRALQVETDTSAECCLSTIKANTCASGAPADSCIGVCSKTAPPCVMDIHAPTIPTTGIVDAGKDCNEAIYNWRKKAEAAIKDGDKNGERIQEEMNQKRFAAMLEKHEQDLKAYEEEFGFCDTLMQESETLVGGFETAIDHQKFRMVTTMIGEIHGEWNHLLNESKHYYGVLTAQDEKLKTLLDEATDLDTAEHEAQVMAKAFHDSKQECAALNKFWEQHEGHWVLEHIRDHIDDRDSQVIWNPMPKWLNSKVGCDEDPSDGCGPVPLMYYPLAYEADYLHDAGIYSFEISDKGDHPRTHLDAAKECADICVNDDKCMGGDVVVLEEGDDKHALSCNLFSRPQAVAVSNNAADMEGFYDRGFIKKSYWDKSGDSIKFTRGWTLCSWETPKEECDAEPYYHYYESH